MVSPRIFQVAAGVHSPPWEIMPGILDSAISNALSVALIVPDARDLESERERLCGLIDRFAAAGPGGCTSHPHLFFGRLTPEEWAILMYKHLDHHLRQFGV